MRLHALGIVATASNIYGILHKSSPAKAGLLNFDLWSARLALTAHHTEYGEARVEDPE